MAHFNCISYIASTTSNFFIFSTYSFLAFRTRDGIQPPTQLASTPPYQSLSHTTSNIHLPQHFESISFLIFLGFYNSFNFLKCHVSCTDGKVSDRIKTYSCWSFVNVKLQQSNAQAGRQKKPRQPTRPAENINKLTKGLQELTTLTGWTTLKPEIKGNFNVDSNSFLFKFALLLYNTHNILFLNRLYCLKYLIAHFNCFSYITYFNNGVKINSFVLLVLLLCWLHNPEGSTFKLFL